MTHPAAIKAKSWNDTLREERVGICLHYDASATDESSIQWLASAGVKVSYNFVVADSGNTIPFAPELARAWHAGVCRSSDPRLPYKDANSALYGISISATAGDVATLAQKRSVAALCRTLFLKHGWPITEVWRIVSHRTESWPRGVHPNGEPWWRKNDPEGPDLAHPVMNTNEIRGMVAAMQMPAAA